MKDDYYPLTWRRRKVAYWLSTASWFYAHALRYKKSLLCWSFSGLISTNDVLLCSKYDNFKIFPIFTKFLNIFVRLIFFHQNSVDTTELMMIVFSAQQQRRWWWRNESKFFLGLYFRSIVKKEKKKGGGCHLKQRI